MMSGLNALALFGWMDVWMDEGFPKKKFKTAELEKYLLKAKENPYEKLKGNLYNQKHYRGINLTRWAAVTLK